MRTRAVIGHLAFLALLLGAWESALRFGWADPTLLPHVSTVLETLWRLLQDPDFRVDLGITAFEVLLAFVIAAPLAVSTGCILGEKLHFGRVVNPVLHFVLAIPQSVFLPIFILLFGIGISAKVIFGVTHAYFVIAVTTVAAVRSVPQPLVTAARAFGATPRQIYTRVYLPAMLPLVVTGLRIGMIFNIIGVLLAEMYGARFGVGHKILGWGESFDLPKLLAGILLVSVLTIALNELMRAWELRAGRWRPATWQV